LLGVLERGREAKGEGGEEGEIEGGRGEGGRRERGDRGISKHGKGLRVASSYHFRCAWLKHGV
jgi:hypothetical protein